VVDDLPEKKENRTEEEKPERRGPVEVRLGGIHGRLNRVDETLANHLAQRIREQERPDDGVADSGSHHQRPSGTTYTSVHRNLRRLTRCR
jgi:hypothetical protein